MAEIYHQRHPERTVFYRVLFHYFDSFLLEYENRFEREYGYLRPVIREVVEKYLDCDNPKCGFARVRCPDCGTERLLTFSCKVRGFCPSWPNGLPLLNVSKDISFPDFSVFDYKVSLRYRL